MDNAHYYKRTTPLTNEERLILALANRNGKFAIEVGASLSPSRQTGLESLQLRGLIQLIDVSPVTEFPTRLFRVWLATPEALAAFRTQEDPPA